MASKKRTPEMLLAAFQESYDLTDRQRDQFTHYYNYLTSANEKLNLTAIISLKGILDYHFADSFIIKDFIDMTTVENIADVGAGAGFPALPLKIMFPHLHVVLIEVTRKKQDFLRTLITTLDLSNVEICGLDWRTFLRTTEGSIDLFLSRATFDEVELCRLFKQTSSYRDATMVYWASHEYKPNKKVDHLIKSYHNYRIYKKDRKLVFMSL